jgi:hypothetical protein
VKITIVVKENVVGIDGAFRPYDLSSLTERAIQFDTDLGVGHVEYDDRANLTIDAIYFDIHYRPFSDAYLADIAAESADAAAKEGVPFPVWSAGENKYICDIVAYKQDLLTRVRAKRDALIALGVPFQFPDAPGTIQTRDLVDFRNISAVSTAGLALVVTQNPATLVFRDTENVIHTLTGIQAITMGLYVSSYCQAIYDKCWAKETGAGGISTLTTQEECDAYDVDVGWS